MQFQILAYTDVPAALKSGVDQINISEFETDPIFGQFKFPTPGWQLFGMEGDQIAVTLEIHQRTITVGDQPVFVGGISGVVTAPNFRKQGLGAKAVQAATEFIRTDIQPPYALLICKPHLIKMYADLGWQSVDKPVIFEQPDGSQHQFPPEIQPMIYPFTDAPWHGGTIHMRGLPW